jgi:hypothetical protein
MQSVASNNPEFLKTLENWCKTQPEVLALVRYRCGAGSREYRLFSSYGALLQWIQEAPAGACVTIFKNPDFPIRGIVDEKFIESCLQTFPEGAEYLMIETTNTVAGKLSWYHYGSGTSRAELKDDLENSIGIPVVVGYHPEMSAGPEEALDGVIPDADGIVRRGPY